MAQELLLTGCLLAGSGLLAAQQHIVSSLGHAPQARSPAVLRLAARWAQQADQIELVQEWVAWVWQLGRTAQVHAD